MSKKNDRPKLAKAVGIRGTHTGTMKRFGKKRGWLGFDEDTVLLTNIKDAKGEVVCDHLWFNLTKGFQDAGKQPGDVVQVDARAVIYEKGYQGYRDIERWTCTSTKLSHPTKIRMMDNVSCIEGEQYHV